MDENRPRINRDDYPSNAHADKSSHKVEKIVTGKVVKKKKSFCKQMKENILGEDIKEVGSYVFWDTLVPALKNTIVDMLTGGIEMFFFGKRVSNSSRNKDRGRTYVSYNSMYDKTPTRKESSYSRKSVSLDDIIFETAGEADTVLDHLVGLTEEYGMVSVADYYDLVGQPGNFTDNKYGWVNLSDAKVMRVRGGYFIDLPKPVLLD